MANAFERQRLHPATLSAILKEKWPEDLLLEGYVPLPKRVLRALPTLFPDDKAIEELVVVLSYIDYRRPAVSRKPSLEFLAFNAGLTPKQFTAAIRRLEKKGHVSRSGDDERVTLDLDGFMDEIRRLAPEDK